MSGTTGQGKVALITGAGMGMGREAVGAVRRGGRAHRGVRHRRARRPPRRWRSSSKAGGEALAAVGDVAVEADVQRMVEEGVRRFGALHVLYNNAGVLWKDRDRVGAGDGRRPVGPGDGHQPQVGVLGDQVRDPAPARGGRRLHHPGGLGVGAGRLHARPGRLHRGQGRADLAQQVARHPVRQGQASAPTSSIRGSSRPRCRRPTSTTSSGRSSRRASRSGRIGQPRDIAYAALFLASDESSFMTGAEMIVDGGFMAQ